MERNTNPPNIPSLPKEMNINIVQRLGVVDKVTGASGVCQEWRNFCMDEGMWKVIDMRNNPTRSYDELCNICTIAISRASNSLQEIYITNFANDQLLERIRNR